MNVTSMLNFLNLNSGTLCLAEREKLLNSPSQKLKAPLEVSWLTGSKCALKPLP